jgi:hypothetical protein
MNVKRRHLTASQRSIIAARLVTTTNGGNRSVKLPTEITQDKVAELSGVATKMVTDAKKVLDYTDDPEIAKKVLNGEVAVAAAAKQVREKEREAKGKPPRKTKSEADVAAEAYKALQEKLVDALRELKEVSGLHPVWLTPA